MTKLIRHRGTKAFLKKDGGWTDEVVSAWHFQEIREELEVKNHLKLTDVELYYAFKEKHVSEWDFAVPLPELAS